MKSFDEWKDDQSQQDLTSSQVILIMFIMMALLAGLTSCTSTRNGYGCKGNQSWEKLVRRIN